MTRPLRVPSEGFVEGRAALGEAAASYVVRVHRLGPGDRLVLFDPERALEADAEIVAASRRGVELSVGPPRPASVRASREVTLVQAIGKGDK
ncbi:MAG TPA: RNA methyltransferase PUA domain-containing protein, partial [Minicystis sp.]|nr:RNA methyltransferase PUA domain-containing protein [Minicystis sp.]